MFKTNATGSVGNEYVNKDVGGGIAGTEIDADDGNITQDELVNAVESGGFVLDPTGVIRNQLAMSIASVAGTVQLHGIGGAVNAYLAVPVNNTAQFPALSDQLDGFTIVAFFNIPNTGATTLNWNGDGVKDVKTNTGADLTGGELNGWAVLFYSQATGNWVYMYSPTNTDIINGSVTMEKLYNGSPESDNVRDRVCKCWGAFDAGSGSVVIRSDFNVSSITHNGTGIYTVNIDVDMPNGDYAVVTGGNRSQSISDANPSVVSTYGQQVNDFHINTHYNGVLTDFNNVFFAVFANT